VSATYDDSLEGLSQRGFAIATAHPIAGASATEAEVVARNAAVLQVLDSLRIPAPTRRHPNRATGAKDPGNTWYTVVLEDDTVAGHWADSMEEAVIECAMWHEQIVVQATRDPSSEHYHAMKAARAKGRDSAAVTLW
jgi:hypothetical protein